MNESIPELKRLHLLAKPELKKALINIENIIKNDDGEAALFSIQHLSDAIISYDEVTDRLFAEIEKLQNENERWNSLRPEVQWFAEQMEKQLQKHEDRGGWKECDNGYLIDEVFIKANNLLNDLNFTDSEKQIKEAVNVANFAMMIADNARTQEGSQEPKCQHGKNMSEQCVECQKLLRSEPRDYRQG